MRVEEMSKSYLVGMVGQDQYDHCGLGLQTLSDVVHRTDLYQQNFDAHC